MSNSGDETSEDDEDNNATSRQAAMDNLVPPIDASDYGQMPATFHRNSQRARVPPESENEPNDGLAVPPDNPTTAASDIPMRQPILEREKYDGVDSDDETDSEEERENEDDEELPQVVGDIEVDMGEEEDEFLEFARQTLGINDEMWGSIVQDRKGRGGKFPNTLSAMIC